LRFFVKDPIGWKKYTKAGFYKTLHALRRNNPALAATASYERCKTDNKNVYAYFRTQDSNRVLTVLNLSGKKRKVSIRHSQLPGTPTDPFTNQSTPISASLTLLMPAWGYRVLVY
jgi:glycosidase